MQPQESSASVLASTPAPALVLARARVRVLDPASQHQVSTIFLV